MATLREYFDTDFTYILNAGNTITLANADGKIEVTARVHLDFNANVKFLSFYIPATDKPFEAVIALINNLDNALSISDILEIQTGLPGEKLRDSKNLRFSGMIFFYSETSISENQIAGVQEEIQKKGLVIQYRGPEFATSRSAIEKPLAFISHDSRDKDGIARPIAVGLSKIMCPVWFDEFSLKVGDRLRESIEKGIKECKKCILILSPNFLANERWTKTEFNSIFTKELIEQTDVILPVWCSVNERDIYDYSPSLLNKVGINISLGADEVVRRLHKAII